MDNFNFGKSFAMKKISQSLKTISNTNLPIFIEGETGTGKTLLARKIHSLSQGSNGLFLYLDCATISPALMESEIFGHEKGAFTGATESKSGLFELACGGTVFLDEIENLELTIQAKLLRVIEEKRFRRVGGKEEIEVYFRLLSACNVPIREKVRQGLFRQDLYYRLRGTTLYLPPLRERIEDISNLIDYFLNKFNIENNCNKQISNDVRSYLTNYRWPGNVRELKYAIEDAAIKSKENEIMLEDFSLDLQMDFIISESRVNQKSLSSMEKKYIEAILSSVDFNKTRAAKMMGIGLNTLYRKIKKYGIKYEKNNY